MLSWQCMLSGCEQHRCGGMHGFSRTMPLRSREQNSPLFYTSVLFYGSKKERIAFPVAEKLTLTFVYLFFCSDCSNPGLACVCYCT